MYSLNWSMKSQNTIHLRSFMFASTVRMVSRATRAREWILSMTQINIRGKQSFKYHRPNKIGGKAAWPPYDFHGPFFEGMKCK